MSSVYTGNLTVSIFGQSHAPAIGVTVDGLPAGLPVDPDELQRFLSRRAPGQNAWSTPPMPNTATRARFSFSMASVPSRSCVLEN